MARGPGERLRARWAAAGAARAGASEAALVALEQALQVALPADFREYLAIVDGMDQWVGNEIEFWSVARIQEDARDWGCFAPGFGPTLLPFADFLINSHAYAIRVSSADAPVFVAYDPAFMARAGLGPPVVQCADSFEEFVARYEEDHPAIYGR